MGKWAIVAIPSVDDYVWKLSSEKVPHLTILYLGEQEMGPEASKIESFVEHAAKTSLNQFGLSVDRRGNLGEDDADVLFFNQRSTKQLEQFRHFLLTNEAISSAYNSVEQFPSWTPHLTLGFPETPAKPDKRDYSRVDYVEFDKIAVWFGDYEGPEFILDPYEFKEDMAMSDSVEEFLSHYGVKGMKWGVRNDKGHEGKRAKTKKIAKLDNKFARNARTIKLGFAVYNRAADLTNKNDISRINNKPQYKDKDFTKDSPLRRKYYKEHERAFLDNLERAASEHGTNASGTKKYTILEKPDGSWDIVLKDVEHEDATMTVKPKFDTNGHIVELEIVDDSITQSSFQNNEFLSHYGVKGMKWGVRKDGSPGSSSVTSDDAKQAASAKAKIASGGTKSLSNKELQDLVTRMNLEQQYSRLSSSPSTLDKGKKFIDNGLWAGKKTNEVIKFLNSPAGKAAKGLFKKGLLLAL